MGLQGEIHFLGALEPECITIEYLTATCLIIPSIREPWGIVANEALHHGCPVIASSICGCVPELLENELFALIFQVNDIEDLVDKMFAAIDCFSNTEFIFDLATKKMTDYLPDIAAKQMIDGFVKFSTTNSSI